MEMETRREQGVNPEEGLAIDLLAENLINQKLNATIVARRVITRSIASKERMK